MYRAKVKITDGKLRLSELDDGSIRLWVSNSDKAVRLTADELELFIKSLNRSLAVLRAQERPTAIAPDLRRSRPQPAYRPGDPASRGKRTAP